MRNIDHIILCPLGADEDITIRQLDRQHRTSGAMKVRHHFLLRRNGALDVGRPASEPGLIVDVAPAVNQTVLGIAVAALDISTMTDIQRRTYNILLAILKHIWPDAKIIEEE
jgi:hypothetical protein